MSGLVGLNTNTKGETVMFPLIVKENSNNNFGG